MKIVTLLLMMGLLVQAPTNNWSTSNRWRCSMCGQESITLNGNSPTEYGCSHSGDGCHIWVEINW